MAMRRFLKITYHLAVTFGWVLWLMILAKNRNLQKQVDDWGPKIEAIYAQAVAVVAERNGLRADVTRLNAELAQAEQLAKDAVDTLALAMQALAQRNDSTNNP